MDGSNERSVRWESARTYNTKNSRDSPLGTIDSYESSFYSASAASLVSPRAVSTGNSPYISPGGSTSGKPRKSKLEKIRELLDENRQLKDTAYQLQQQLNEKEIQMKKSHYSQAISGQGTKEGKPSEKHIQALRALTAVTKTQQESLALHHERHESLRREVEEHEHEAMRLRKDLHKKKKEVVMLEKEIDSNLLEITGLRKELHAAVQQTETSEAELRSDRRTILELKRELALVSAGQGTVANAVKTDAFDEEIRKKDEEIEALQKELEKHMELIRQLQGELDRTQEQVEQYERERDATVADMETYYEALKHELEEKNRLLEEAEREKEEMDRETTAALRALEERCDQLNAEVLDAHDEMSILRRESDASIFATQANETAQLDAADERERLQSNLEAMTSELNILKQRYEEMQSEHDSAIRALEEDNDDLNAQQTEFKAALREANERNREISEKIEVMKVENESLMEISRDLKVQLKEIEAKEEATATTQATSQSGTNGGGEQQSARGMEPPSVVSVVNLEPVSEDNRSQGGDGGDGASLDPEGQQALLLAAAAGRQTPQSLPDKSSGSSWSFRNRAQSKSPIPILGGRSASNASSSGADGQIEKLERMNKEQQETIKKLQSELVRVHAYYRDSAYTTKKKIETLTQENAAYEVKVAVLEKMVEKIGEPPDMHSEDSTLAEDEGSSPNKYLDQIKELEEKVASLESQRTLADDQMKALQMDLDTSQESARQAARDSLLTIERLKRENAEKDRRLSELADDNTRDAPEGTAGEPDWMS